MWEGLWVFVLVVRRVVRRVVLRDWVPSGEVVSVMVSVVVSSSVAAVWVEVVDCSATKSPRTVAAEAVDWEREDWARESEVEVWAAWREDAERDCFVEQEVKRAMIMADATIRAVVMMLRLVRSLMIIFVFIVVLIKK